MLAYHRTKACALVCSLALALGLAACGGSETKQAPTETTAVETTTTETPEVDSTTDATTEPAPVESAPVEPAPAAPEAPTDATYITSDEAKAIALADAGVDEASTTELEVELDTDDAIANYDVDFKAGGMEYDYEIDAITGQILKGTSEVDD